MIRRGGAVLLRVRTLCKMKPPYRKASDYSFPTPAPSIPQEAPPPLPEKVGVFSVPRIVVANEEAHAEFVRIVTELDGKLKGQDLSLISDYCLLHADCIKLTEECEGEPFTCMSEKGGSYVNPIHNVLSGKRAALAQLRRDLYFTPKSRAEKAPKSAAKGERIVERVRAGLPSSA